MLCLCMSFQNYCKFLGGKLAEPMSKAENNFLMQHAAQSGKLKENFALLYMFLIF